jgi:hypothetical protein
VREPTKVPYRVARNSDTPSAETQKLIVDYLASRESVGIDVQVPTQPGDPILPPGTPGGSQAADSDSQVFF